MDPPRPGGPEEVWRPFKPDPSIAMSQGNREWQEWLVETARSLIERTNADGIFLDSAGWRLNLPTETKQEVVLNSSLENSMAVLNCGVSAEFSTFVFKTPCDDPVTGDSC